MQTVVHLFSSQKGPILWTSSYPTKLHKFLLLIRTKHNDTLWHFFMSLGQNFLKCSEFQKSGNFATTKVADDKALRKVLDSANKTVLSCAFDIFNCCF